MSMRTGTVTRIEGPLLFLRRTVNVGLNEAVEIEDAEGRLRLGRIAALDHDTLTVEVLESTAGPEPRRDARALSGRAAAFRRGAGPPGTRVRRRGAADRRGSPLPAARSLRIDGLAINPAERAVPTDFIETGISTIDLMNSLVRGQKLPIFSGAGLPHDRLAIEIARQRPPARRRGGRVRRGLRRDRRSP